MRTLTTPAALFALSLALPAFAQPLEKLPGAAGVQPPTSAVKADKVYESESGVKYKVEKVATGLQVPWSIAFASVDRILLTERAGRVRVIEKGVLNPEPLLSISVIKSGEDGLMGLCLHPDYAKNKYVYLSYGWMIDAAKKQKDIRVVRYIDKGDKLVEDKAIVTGIEEGGNHSGCCIHFGPDGKLYISTGEHFQGELAQDMSSLNGKILRVNDDGAIPADNPFTGANKKAGTREEIWSFGNRNPQGFDWTADGRLFESEHGPSGEASGPNKGGGDEFNMIEKGHNYGWPVIHHDMTKEGMEAPLHQWTPAIAPAGGAILKSDAYGDKWKGNYFMGALGGLRGTSSEGGVYRIELKDKAVGGTIERLVPDLGRIRAVTLGPDGLLYFTTSNKDGRGKSFQQPDDDKLCRIVPVK